MTNAQAAATLIVIRDCETGPEVLLVKRHQQLSFAPGYWVFPGGKVDSWDFENGVTSEDKAKKTAVRETEEETSLLIHPDKLISTNHWTTPPGYDRRFSTSFFVTHLKDAQDVKIDGDEIVDSIWLSSTSALNLFQSGKMPMMIPTQTSLLEISKFDQCEHVLEWYRGRAVEYR